MNAGEPDKILEISEFSMLRLNDIAEQRTLYSSVDDIVYAHDSDSEFDEPPENSNRYNICYSYLHNNLIAGFKLEMAIPAIKHEQVLIELVGSNRATRLW